MTNRKLVGLVGLARSGKDTTAGRLITNHAFSRHAAFAGPLKEAAMAAFGLTRSEVYGINYDRESPHPQWGISVREILQRLGTEAIRNVFNHDHWVQLMENRLTEGDLSTGDVVITDVRFQNEVDLIKRLGGGILGLVRTECQPEVNPHVSEELAAYHLSEVSDRIVYAANIGELYDGIDITMEEWNGKTAGV